MLMATALQLKEVAWQIGSKEQNPTICCIQETHLIKICIDEKLKE